MSNDSTFWDECYAEGKTGWDRGAVHPSLIRLLENGGLEPCQIVVPGCGRGYEVIELARRGFAVTGIDIADEPVQHLRKGLARFKGTAEVLQVDFADYRPDSPVDAVYEQTCLCAIDPALRLKYEETVFNWLKPNGKLFVLFMQKSWNPNEGPPFHCDLEDMRQLFPVSRWQWSSDGESLRFEHPSGKLHEIGMELTRIA